MPALRKFIAMPPPMVPAPITRDLRDLAARRVLGHVGNLARGPLAEERVAKSARLGPHEQIREAFALDAKAFLEGLVDRGRHASMHFNGAGKFFDIAPTVLRANCRNASGLSCFTLLLRSWSRGRFSATTFFANATAPSTKSPWMISANNPSAASCSDGTLAPDTIMLSAASRPIARGRR